MIREHIIFQMGRYVEAWSGHRFCPAAVVSCRVALIPDKVTNTNTELAGHALTVLSLRVHLLYKPHRNWGLLDALETHEDDVLI